MECWVLLCSSGDHPITIAFSNPSMGTIKTRAEFCNDVKEDIIL